MSPIDYRNATFRDLHGRLVNLRASVYEALMEHGPCTTRELARACDIDLLTVRPRVTELVQLGFAECLDEHGHEGRYRALTLAEAETLFCAAPTRGAQPATGTGIGMSLITPMENPTQEPVWAIVELMGHVRYGGLVSKDNQFGTAMLRVDVPQADGSFVSQLINPSSLYRVTMCTENLARAAAAAGNPAPLQQWEVRHLLPKPASSVSDDDDCPL